jgi:hypothetical protein
MNQSIAITIIVAIIFLFNVINMAIIPHIQILKYFTYILDALSIITFIAIGITGTKFTATQLFIYMICLAMVDLCIVSIIINVIYKKEKEDDLLIDIADRIIIAFLMSIIIMMFSVIGIKTLFYNKEISYSTTISQESAPTERLVTHKQIKDLYLQESCGFAPTDSRNGVLFFIKGNKVKYCTTDHSGNYVIIKGDYTKDWAYQNVQVKVNGDYTMVGPQE